MHLTSITQLLQNFSILASETYIAKWEKLNIINVSCFFLSNFNQLTLLDLSCVRIVKPLSAIKW